MSCGGSRQFAKLPFVYRSIREFRRSRSGCFRRFVPRPARQAQASSEACHVRDDLFSAPVLVEAAYAVRSPKHVRHPPDQVCLDIGPRFVY